MKIATYLILVFLRQINAYSLIKLIPGSPEVISDERVKVVEGNDFALSATFGPGYLNDSSEYVLKVKEKSGNNYSVAIGNVPEDDFYRIKVDYEAGEYEVQIYSVPYEFNENIYTFQLTYSTNESETPIRIQEKIQLFVTPVPHGAKIDPMGVIDVNQNQFIRFHCRSYNSFPGCVISWTRNKSNRSSSLNGAVFAGENCTSTIWYRTTGEDNQMDVECTVRNRDLNEFPEKYQTTANVTVFVRSAPKVEIIPKDPIKVFEGNSQNLTCYVTAYPKPHTVQWTFQDKVIVSHGSVFHVDTRRQNAGVYTCRATNTFGTSVAHAMVEIQYRPEINSIADQEVIAGGTFSTMCDSKSVPPPLIYFWTREKNSNFRVTGQRLTLKNLQPEDADTYVCVALNAITSIGNETVPGTAKKSFKLKVRHGPGKSTAIASSLTELEGRSVTFTCQSYPPGHPAPITRWVTFSTGKIISNATILELEVKRGMERVSCEQENIHGKSILSPPAKLLPQAVDQYFSKSILGRYIATTATIQLNTMNFTFPVSFKIDVMRKNSRLWEFISLDIYSPQNITLSNPSTVVDVRLFVCGQLDVSCQRIKIVQDGKTADIGKLSPWGISMIIVVITLASTVFLSVVIFIIIRIHATQQIKKHHNTPSSHIVKSNQCQLINKFHRNTILFQVGDAYGTAESIASLRPQEYLDGEVVNAMCRLLVQNHPKLHTYLLKLNFCLKHHFHQYVCNPESFSDLPNSIMLSTFFVPLFHINHYFLVKAEIPSKKMYVFDSKPSTANVKEHLLELKKSFEAVTGISTDYWEKDIYEVVQQQRNDFSCGDHVIKMLECLLTNKQVKNISPSCMDKIRSLIAEELLHTSAEGEAYLHHFKNAIDAINAAPSVVAIKEYF